MEKFNESLSFGIQEGMIDEAKRTVRVCALVSCISRNNRYYSPKIVKSAAGKLIGKKSFADHEERNTKNLVGRIVNEQHKDNKLYADIRISTAKGIASQTWEKLKDGTIDSVSIAADGQAKMVKMGEQIVQEVTELDIHSVDFVTEGGVADAKVTRVFENVKDIPTIKEVKEDMTIENLKQLKEQYPDLLKEATKELEEKNKKLTEDKEAAELKLVEKELATFKAEEIKKLEVNDDVASILSKRATGKTKEELSASIKTEVDLIESIKKATEKEATIDGVVEDKKKKKKEEATAWTAERITSDTRIPEEFKEDAKRCLLYQGSKAMIEFLATRDVTL